MTTINRIHRNLRVLFLLLFSLGTISMAMSQLTMPKVFSNHMMLQRGIDIPVWGKANPEATIRVDFNGSGFKTQADASGNWKLYLPKMKEGGPFSMRVFVEGDPSQTLEFNDILIGDIWLASGQSNMEWEVQQSMNAATEIKNASYPQIRLFRTEHKISTSPQFDVSADGWQVCDTNTVKHTSAVAWFFARQLHRDLNVPIGILQTTWGGTPVETWISREPLLSSPLTHDLVLAHDTLTAEDFVQDSINAIKFWELIYQTPTELVNTVSINNYNDTNWPELTMPSTFKDWNWPWFEGMVWFRKTVNLSKMQKGKDLTINLGYPEMNYSVYFNGTEICKNIWNSNPTHEFTIPAHLVLDGENTIAIRLAVLWGGGGINPPAERLYITDGKDKISLAGSWKCSKELENNIPRVYYYQNFHTFVYNAMLHPLIPFGIKGFIWYQGESNAYDAAAYRELFPMMINDWRIRWNQGYLPFLFVQLANFMKENEQPTESDWAELRESQTYTLRLPNTGMACAIDVGDANDIHPRNKQEVGRRLALQAEKIAYGKNLVAQGPMFKGYKQDDDKIIVEFDEAFGGLKTSDNGSIQGFAIAGDDQIFHWAQAQIDGNTVVVSSSKVKKPVAVRYAWADNPKCNLINGAGLPAIPFRTDEWTNKKK